MGCLKCGKKTKDGQVFCLRCMQVMEAYPVKADVHVHLPNRHTQPITKKNSAKRRSLSPEEQVVCLRRRVRWLTAAVVLLALLAGTAVGLLLFPSASPEDGEIGKNYTVGNPFE